MWLWTWSRTKISHVSAPWGASFSRHDLFNLGMTIWIMWLTWQAQECVNNHCWSINYYHHHSRWCPRLPPPFSTTTSLTPNSHRSNSCHKQAQTDVWARGICFIFVSQFFSLWTNILNIDSVQFLPTRRPPPLPWATARRVEMGSAWSKRRESSFGPTIVSFFVFHFLFWTLR
jgi:hypothetical protein